MYVPISVQLQLHDMYSSFAVSDPFNVEYWRDLEFWVRGNSRLFKVTPFDSVVSFLFTFHSNYDRIFSRFDTEHERDKQKPSKTPRDGIGRAYA